MKDWKKRKLGTIDLDTQKLMDGNFVFVQEKIKWREPYFMGFQEMFIVLAKDKEIQGRTRSVLDYLFGSLNFENYICLEQKKIAEELSMLQPNVSRAIKLLVKKGIIAEGPKLGKMCSYKLDSHIGWKGTLKNLTKERHAHLRLAAQDGMHC